MEGLKIKLGNVKYHDHNGKRFLSFNVYAQWGEDFALLINGFRLLGGKIMPPASKRGYAFYPVVYGSDGFARAVYEALIASGEPERSKVLLNEGARGWSPVVYTENNLNRLVYGSEEDDA
jgi:hypothetical protein